MRVRLQLPNVRPPITIARSSRPGRGITFENSGAIAHTVTASDGDDFDSGTVEPGGKFEFTATKAGSINYVCSFHPGMRGSIGVG